MINKNAAANHNMTVCKELENEVQNKASLCGMKATNELEW